MLRTLMAFTNLIRFKDEKGEVHYGDVREDQLDSLIKSKVAVLEGDPFQGGVIPSGRMAVVHEVRRSSGARFCMKNKHLLTQGTM
jgi:hypothetical protein